MMTWVRFFVDLQKNDSDRWGWMSEVGDRGRSRPDENCGEMSSKREETGFDDADESTCRTRQAGTGVEEGGAHPGWSR